jgi:phosphatidylglycerol:prolipoprotein diacylglycerol transferase
MFPEIKFSDSIVIETYLLYISVLYCFLLFYVLQRARNRPGLSDEVRSQKTTIALDLSLIMMVGGFLGARAVHVFYEMPEYYSEDWTRAFKFWQGGFVFYGGFIVAFAACWIFLRLRKLSFLEWADFFAPVLALGYGLGRISCFLAGCCYGRSCDAPWAVVFPWDYHQVPRHPTQIYAVLWELAVYALLIWLEKRKLVVREPGKLFAIWLTFHALGRLMMEYYREDFRGDLIIGLTISTWVSLLLLASSLAALAALQIRSRR